MTRTRINLRLCITLTQLNSLFNEKNSFYRTLKNGIFTGHHGKQSDNILQLKSILLLKKCNI